MRKTLVIGAAIVVVVLLTVAGVLILTADRETTVGEPGKAVRGYLEALARGDAAAALSYGAPLPADGGFLTEEVLDRQLARAPITGITIHDEATSGPRSRVHASAKFGDIVSDATLSLSETGDGWKLDAAAIEIHRGGALGADAPARSLTLFGRPLTAAATYVFPGAQDWGTDNDYLQVSAAPILLDGLGALGFDVSELDFRLSDRGRQAAGAALTAALQSCAESRSPAPPGCPQHIEDPDVAPDTVYWRIPDAAPVRAEGLSGHSTRVPFSGELEFTADYRTRSDIPSSATVTTTVTGSIDVSAQPPTVSFD